VVEFDKFSLDLIFEESKAEIGRDYAFMGLDILETINQIPYFELGLTSNYLAPLQVEKNIKLKYQSDELNYEAPLGINSIIYDGYTVLIKGWMTEWENFKTTNTRYLGNSLKSAISRLGIREDILCEDDIATDVFQINKSNLLQCLSLCQALSNVPYWNIGRYSINLQDSTESTDQDPLTNGKLVINTQDPLEIIQGDTIRMASTSLKDKYCESNIHDRDAFDRMIMNRKLQDIGMKYSMICSCNYEYEWPVGTHLANNNSLYPEINEWVVTSTYYHYRQSGVSTNIQYGGII
jgi:hypothetical protein